MVVCLTEIGPVMNGDKPITEAPRRILTIQDLLLTVPLYEQVSLRTQGVSFLLSLCTSKRPLDCFCRDCGRHSVFIPIPQANPHPEVLLPSHCILELWFSCSRNKDHRLCFVFHAHGDTLQKIGQYPSFADLAIPDLQKYRAILGKDDYGDLSRGVGLAAHGIGAGAFVYVRRIFERLIEEARIAASGQAGWNEESYGKSRMTDRIAMLKDHLPEFLVQNKALYSIMSVGVHTLSEEQCLGAFPLVRMSIELILDDHLEKAARKKKIEEAQKGIAAMSGALKNGSAKSDLQRTGSETEEA